MRLSDWLITVVTPFTTKGEAVKLYTEVPDRGYLRNGQNDFKKQKVGKLVAIIAIDEVRSIIE